MKLVYVSIALLTSTILACTKAQNSAENNSIKQANTIIQKDSIPYACDYLGEQPPGDKAVLFSPNFISTKVEHSAVMCSPDGMEIWFGRMYPAKIWYLTYTNGTWSEINKAPLDDTYHYLYPFLSPDGNKLYFTSDLPVIPGGDRQHRGDGDLWYIQRDQLSWSKPIHLGDTINFGNRHSIGSVSASGNMYYTVRTGKLYHYTTKMYFAEFENNRYKTPVIISELNSDQPTNSPYVSPDESYLIFSSFRGGIGMSDLFISFKTEDGKWTRPKNLGPNINSSAKEGFPFVSPDGKFLFFNSSRISSLNETKILNGPGNMYWVDAGFIEALKVEAFSTK